MQLRLFEIADFDAVYHRSFLNSELGKLYSTIPFQEIAEAYRKGLKRHPQGQKAVFTIEGGLGLMFLKHYTNLSDSKLIKALNTNWHYQMFCGLARKDDYGIKDMDIVGRWRRFFGARLDIQALQKILAQTWKEDLPHKQVSLQDATVYESYIKYPTDVGLLWDCVEWTRELLVKLCKEHKIARPRSKYKKQKIKQIDYSKRRKKSYKLTRRRQAALLRLLPKLLGQLQAILNRGASVIEGIKPSVFKRIKTIRTILIQQRYHFEQPTKSVPHRIVSLYKPYIRPIVRGKENKPVEFGAKVHQVQVGGCNFMEHLDFEAFHEGNRLKRAVWMQCGLFGSVHQLAADGIYATNANRSWCREHKIATCFKPKGKQGPHKEQKETLRNTLSIIRGTVLEGSFGNEKNHYTLRKVKARTQETEIAWIFFGVHTANAVKIMNARNQKKNNKMAA